jgi:signal transduction histidine kinase
MHPADRSTASTGGSRDIAIGGAMQAPVAGGWKFWRRGGTWTGLAPLITAVLALAALAAVPWTVRSKLANVRLATAETIGPARQLVRDIADASVLELIVRRDAGSGHAPEGMRRSNPAAEMMRVRDSAFVAIVPRLGHRVASDVARFRDATARWRAYGGTGTAEEMARVGDVLATAARLDSALAVRQAAQRSSIESLETLDTLMPSMLTPVLAAAMFAIYLTGRRMARSARMAERSRVALAAASVEKVTLLRGLTHDLKNALGAARGYVMLLSEEISGPLSPTQRDQLARISRILDQTLTAVHDALLVARTEAGTLPVRWQREDLHTLVLDVAADYVAEAERAGLTLTVEFSDELPLVDTDASLVAKIVGNLLSNAIKYTPGKGRIWLRTSRKGPITDSDARDWVGVEVCDTGPGIAGDLREKVFDEFFRAPAVTATAKGDGIGLAMSRRVARLLNGDITLGPPQEGGATFILWLPVESRAEEGTTGADARADVEVTIGADGRVQAAPPTVGSTVDYDRRRTVRRNPFADAQPLSGQDGSPPPP